jgi:hypothetical protein
MKRFIIAFFAAFIFMFFWGWFYNGVMLKDVSTEVQNLFRPREEIMGMVHWIIIGQAGLALSIRPHLCEWIRWRWHRSRGAPRNYDRIFGGQCALRDLCDATFPRESAGADKHRRLHRDGRDWRNCRRDLQTCVCAKLFAVI